MITPSEIRKQAERWWPEVLRAGLRGEAFFPKALTRIGKVKSQERLRAFERIRAAQDALLVEAKPQVAHSYTLHWEEHRSHTIGRNRFISSITFESLDDYLGLLKRKAAYRRFIKDSRRLTERFPPLREWCENHPLGVEKYHAEWPDLLCVLDYFVTRHQWDAYYIRELPVAVPTKFIENHRSILSSLLDTLLPPESIRTDYAAPKHFEQRYGLRRRQPLLRLRLLDPSQAATYFSGLSDLSLPFHDFAQLDLPLQRLIILENKTSFSNLMNFLTLPQLAATAGLFGSGFKVALLKNVPWLHHLQLYYWGDIDAHGLQILAQLRSYFPHVRPFLMDRKTFDAFPQYHTAATASTATQLPGLTPSEQALFTHLNTNQLRLEQERIPHAYVQEVVQELLRDD